MSIKCIMNGLEVNYPCSPSCHLFGDCFTAFESQKKSNVRTNADRIRAMSDEELAEMLWKNGRNYRSVCADPVVDYNEQRDNLIEWLKQPAE